MDKLPFGRTGHHSSRVIFGAAALGKVTQAEADSTLETILAHGVNHIDTAASYGESELRIGPWMAEHRADFFVATKTGERTAAKAREELHRSLERLRIDSVDMLQLHCLIDEDEWNTAMGPGGALEAAIAAREEGLVSFIGVTGHGTEVAAMHLRSLERFDFDAVLLPYNYSSMQNSMYAADFERLMTLCRDREVAVQTIKGITRAPWHEKPRTSATWYEPLDKQVEIDLAVRYVLNRPRVFLNSAGDIHLLPRVLDAAENFFDSDNNDRNELARQLADLKLEPLFV